MMRAWRIRDPTKNPKATKEWATSVLINRAWPDSYPVACWRTPDGCDEKWAITEASNKDGLIENTPRPKIGHRKTLTWTIPEPKLGHAGKT